MRNQIRMNYRLRGYGHTMFYADASNLNLFKYKPMHSVSLVSSLVMAVHGRYFTKYVYKHINIQRNVDR